MRKFDEFMGGIPTSLRLRLTEIAEALGNPPLGRWLGVAMPIRFWCGGVHRLPTVTDALERGAGRLLQGRPTGSSVAPSGYGARHAETCWIRVVANRKAGSLRTSRY